MKYDWRGCKIAKAKRRYETCEQEGCEHKGEPHSDIVNRQAVGIVAKAQDSGNMESRRAETSSFSETV